MQAPTASVRGESTSTPPNTVINQPVIERVVETVRTVDAAGISSADLDARLVAFAQDFTNRLQLKADNSLRQEEILSDSIGERFTGDLNDLTIVGSKWTGGTITNATITGVSLTIGYSLRRKRAPGQQAPPPWRADDDAGRLSTCGW